MRGYGGRFDPYGRITREQLAAMLHRYAEHAGASMSVPVPFDLDSFQDRCEISGWAETYMYWAVHNGLIRGADARMLSPTGAATRAEVAAILTRFKSD